MKRTAAFLASLALVSSLYASPERVDVSKAQGVVNVNTASLEQLQLLWRTGRTTAQAIIDGRPYETAEQLDQVKGIGARWATVNGPFIVLDGATTLTVKLTVPQRVEPK